MKKLEDSIKEYLEIKKNAITYKEAFDVLLQLPEGKGLLLEVRECTCKTT